MVVVEVMVVLVLGMEVMEVVVGMTVEVTVTTLVIVVGGSVVVAFATDMHAHADE